VLNVQLAEDPIVRESSLHAISLLDEIRGNANLQSRQVQQWYRESSCIAAVLAARTSACSARSDCWRTEGSPKGDWRTSSLSVSRSQDIPHAVRISARFSRRSCWHRFSRNAPASSSPPSFRNILLTLSLTQAMSGFTPVTAIQQLQLTINLCYIYQVPPLSTATGHRAESWNLASPMVTGSCKIITTEGKAIIQVYNEVPNPNGPPGSTMETLFACCPIDQVSQPPLGTKRKPKPTYM